MSQVYPVGEHSINQIRCRSAVYNLTEIWVERSNQGSLKPIQLTKPILSSSHVVGLKTGNGLINAAFDPDTNEVSNDEKWVGHGDHLRVVDGQLRTGDYYFMCNTRTPLKTK